MFISEQIFPLGVTFDEPGNFVLSKCRGLPSLPVRHLQAFGVEPLRDGVRSVSLVRLSFFELTLDLIEDFLGSPLFSRCD